MADDIQDVVLRKLKRHIDRLRRREERAEQQVKLALKKAVSLSKKYKKKLVKKAHEVNVLERMQKRSDLFTAAVQKLESSKAGCLMRHVMDDTLSSGRRSTKGKKQPSSGRKRSSSPRKRGS